MRNISCDGISKYALKLPCIALMSVFLLAGCGPAEDLQELDFKETVELQQMKTSPAREINICVGSMVTAKEGYAYYKRFLDYIGQKLGMKVNFVEKGTYGEVNALLRDAKIDVAFVCGGPYVEAHDEFGLELLAAPVVAGRAVYYSYIIAAADSGIEEFQQLRGKTFAFVDPLSNTGRLIPAYMLYMQNETPDTFFKETSYTYSHDKSIRAVAHGIVDAAAVDSLIWEYLDKEGSPDTKKTKIIKVSGPCGIPPVAVRPGLDSALKARIKAVLLNMHNEKEGREILRGMRIDKFVAVDDSNYNSIRHIKSLVGK